MTRPAPARLFRRRKRAMDNDERIMPLVNIVFLLLIFFMVVGRLSAADPFKVLPPESANEGPQATEDNLVLIGQDGRLALNGEILPEDALLAKLSDVRADELRVKADGRAEAVRVVAVIERLKTVGFVSVRLMTVPRLDDAP